MTSRAQLACSILVYSIAATCVAAQPQSQIPTSEEIVAQMAQAQSENHAHFRPYKVTRDYKLFRGDSQTKLKSRLTAEISVVPSVSKKYTVENTDGSLLEERIVRKMLDGEVAFARDSGSSDITPTNYDF